VIRPAVDGAMAVHSKIDTKNDMIIV